MSDCYVRPAAPADARRIAQVYVASWRATYRGILSKRALDGLSVDLEARAFRSAVLRSGVGEAVFVAGRRGCPPAGFVTVGPERGAGGRGEVYTLYLLPECQGDGLGRRLMAEAAGQLMADGFTGGVVWVLRDNPARGFYAGLGGVADGQRSFRVGGEEVPAVSYAWADLRVLEERAAGLSALPLPALLPGRRQPR